MPDAQIAVEYRDIQNFPGYRVGNDGSVWSCRKGGAVLACVNRILGSAWRRMKPESLKEGYLRVSLRRDKKTIRYLVHRLVAEAFIGTCPEGHEVCHGDGTKTNNVPSNLRYGTRKENVADAIRHGTTARGERNGKAKLTADQVREIHRLGTVGVSQRERGRIFGVNHTTVGRIDSRAMWSHVA